MKKNLQSIADQLSESDLQEIIKLRKMNDKKMISLRKKRDRVAAELAKLDGQIAKMTGAEPTAPRPRRGRKPGRPAAASTTVAATSTSIAAGAPRAAAKPRKAKSNSKGKTTAGRGAAQRTNLSAAVREVFAKAGAPLKASQVVDGLPSVGVQVKDVQEMRKRVSVVLASQKTYFEQIERGVYQLKNEE